MLDHLTEPRKDHITTVALGKLRVWTPKPHVMALAFVFAEPTHMHGSRLTTKGFRGCSRIFESKLNVNRANAIAFVLG